MRSRAARVSRARRTFAKLPTILNEGHRIVILAGRGALGAAGELEQIAETLGAPIVKALLGKAAVPDDGRSARPAEARHYG